MAQIIKDFDPRKDILLIDPEEVTCREIDNLRRGIGHTHGMCMAEVPVLVTKMKVSHIKAVTVKEFLEALEEAE